MGFRLGSRQSKHVSPEFAWVRFSLQTHVKRVSQHCLPACLPDTNRGLKQTEGVAVSREALGTKIILYTSRKLRYKQCDMQLSIIQVQVHDSILAV